MKAAFIILYLFICFTLTAQIKTSYSIGSIGGDMKTATYSNSFLISGEKCFTVSNALNKFWDTNSGDFFTNCVVDIDFIKYSIKINPNPVANYAMVKLVNKIQHDNKMRLSIFNNTGVSVITHDISQEQLLSGFRLEMSSLPSGYYFIQISSSSILQVFKILKN